MRKPPGRGTLAAGIHATLLGVIDVTGILIDIAHGVNARGLEAVLEFIPSLFHAVVDDPLEQVLLP